MKRGEDEASLSKVIWQVEAALDRGELYREPGTGTPASRSRFHAR